jgi:hypothetical protein
MQLVIQYIVTWRFLRLEWDSIWGDTTSSAANGTAITAAASSDSSDAQEMDLLTASASLLTFYRFMSVSRGSSELSYLLLMIRVIVADMAPFFVVLFFFAISCTNAMFILTDDSHVDFNNVGNAAYSACKFAAGREPQSPFPQP